MKKLNLKLPIEQLTRLAGVVLVKYFPTILTKFSLSFCDRGNPRGTDRSLATIYLRKNRPKNCRQFLFIL